MRLGYDAKRIFHNTTGLGNYSRDLVRIMSTYYPDNEYVLYNPKKAVVNRLELTANMQVREPEDFWSQRFPALWRSKFITRDLIKDQIDIYHGLSAELPAGIDKTPVKSVVTIHDLIFMRYPRLYSFFDRKIYFKKFLKAVESADKVVAISQQTKNDILEFSGIDSQKIEVIYQGCHQAFKKEYPDDFKQKIIEKYQLPQEFLLNVGTIEPRKNAFTIVKAIKDATYHLVLVGRPTAYAQKIKEFVQKHHMEHRVHFLEGLSIEELAVLYQMSKIFIYPSLYEGFGIPIIEALYSKTPVITNKKGVFPEAAGPYSFYMNQVTDPVEMKELIEQIMTKYPVDAVQKSYEFVQQFNDDRIAGKWNNLYKSLKK